MSADLSECTVWGFPLDLHSHPEAPPRGANPRGLGVAQPHKQEDVPSPTRSRLQTFLEEFGGTDQGTDAAGGFQKQRVRL